MLTINLQWDANALAAPQSFRNQVQVAASILDAAIYDPITVNIQIGYGEYDEGGPSYTALMSNISLGGVNAEVMVSYPLLRAALAAAAVSASDIQAVNALPATASLNGQSTFEISLAQAKALGVLPATNTAVDGYAGFPTNFTGTTLTAAAIVELLHAMGLTNEGFSLSLFEYTSPGNHLLTQGTASTPAYFSIDGGNTNLANYDVGFDSTLFTNKSGDPLNVPDIGSTVLTPLDLIEIGAIGFDVTSTPTLPTPSIATTSSGSAIVVTVKNASTVENTAIPVASFITAVSAPSGDSVVAYAFYDQGGSGGHLTIGGVAEPDNQWVYALNTQLGTLQYVGGASPGKETIEVYALDATATSFYQISQLTATTLAPTPPKIINSSGGTSSLYVYAPSATVAETITAYNAPNAAGTMISNIVDNTDGTSILYSYNPSSTVTLTAAAYTATNAANGAPAGAELSDVVDDTNGTCLVYAYNPTSTVTQTTQTWSATNPANGAPAGSEISDVVDNTDGTSLLYTYNPSSTVTQTTSKYAATNPANGAPAGAEISDVLDKTDGTAILYAYNPTSTVVQTATTYSSSDPASGAPTGTITSETLDYTNGQSAITSYTNGVGNTVDYSGRDGTGSVIPAITSAAATTDGVGSAADIPQPTATSAPPVDSIVIPVMGSDQLIDPGTSSHSLQFLSGATDDTLVLHAGTSDLVFGFDPAAGDKLDFASLLAEAQFDPGSVTSLAAYISVEDVNGSAQVLFDPAGHGGGTQVALLLNDGSFAGQIQAVLSS